MAKTSENDILDMSQDWGKDPANGLPFSGRAIQKFIKDTFGSKMGFFYYDTTTNRYLVFADEESKDKYLENPTLIELVLGSFDAPFNYSAEINLISKPYVSIPVGATGNYIEFTFDTKNKNGASVGEDVVCTYTILRGGTKKIVTQKYRAGMTVRFNVDAYLGEGSNRINIGIVGQTTFAATTVGVTYQVVNLTLTDETNISKVYDLSQGGQVMSIPFTVSGYGVKTVEWYLDGEKLEFEKNVDEVVDATSSRIKYITLTNLSRGTHYVEFRAYTLVDDERFYSRVLHRDILIENLGLQDRSTIIALSYEKENLEDTTIRLSQYLAYDLVFAIHNPMSPVATPVEIFLNDTKVTTLDVPNGLVNTYAVIPTETGDTVIKVVAAGTEYSLGASTDENSMGIGEISSGLELGFSSVGRSNSESGKEVWTDGSHSALLTGFNFTQTSGWVNNKLLMQNGAKIEFDYSPLAGGSTAIGKTLEFEFASSNVSDDTAVLCDLTNSSNGSGIIITASEAKIISRGGVSLSVRYKSEENTRISFVVNRAANATNKGLVFIYVNGVISGATNFGSSDDFVSDTALSFSGTDKSEILLKQIRVYNTSLSSDQILNNFILYRDTTEEMLSVFDRNNVYEDGTVSLSVDRLQGQLPVMVVTGDIPALENTTNKDTQITVDIEYYNLQNPSKSFTMKNAAMRPQGTSSMLYPKKNFRIYTQKLEATVLTVNGKVVDNKLYSFVDGAQPVNCWCLKADYAESSGTHNTGIARLWNDLLVNATVDGQFVFRTEAQKKAIESSYGYDVRTTIDGFPILMFYRRDENSELIFIGKYNFNNDKSTESVFGFKGIPGFDNSRMQCWEILNNGDALALFTDVSDFDSRWSEAYESRYPDTSNPNTADLKAFSVWINGVKDNPSAFATQKWSHLNVYLVAAYYVYLMRFGAVDQVVKNAMFTSEDGVHFYFINYDNDTINGLRNNGVLAFDPDIDRQSLDPATGGLAYAYAGHESVLWNLLEGDAEFMEIVKKVDNALYASGLRYDNIIGYFDNKQSDMWNERVCNQDAQYKYIGPYTDAGNNNLLMLQGKRQSHRRWWLSKRFSLYDSKFVSGDFKGKALEFKVINNTAPGWTFTIKAGTKMEYGYGVYNPIETGILLNVGESHSFTVQQTLNIGDPVRIYSAVNLMSVDLSNILPRLSNVELNNVWNEALGSKLKEFILGNGTSINEILTSVSSISKAKRLEKLDIRGCKNITTIDLSELLYMKTLLAQGSGLTSVEFAKGAGITTISLPNTMQVLRLEELTALTSAGLSFEDNGAGIYSMTISGCPNLSKNISFVLNWLDAKTTEDADCVLYMDNISWVNVAPDDFLRICSLKTNGANVTLKGRVKLTDSSQEIVDTIKEAFGPLVFTPTSELYVSAPEAIYLAGPDSILEGESAQFAAAVFSANYGTLSYLIASGSRTGTTINKETGYLTSVENGVSDSTLTIRALHKPTSGSTAYADKTLRILKRIYPSGITISGPVNPSSSTNEYTWSSHTTGVTGEYNVEWVLSGDIVDYASISYSTKDKCIIIPSQQPAEVIEGTLTINLRKKVDNSVAATASKTLNMLNENIIMTNKTNPTVMKIMYDNGLAANETFMTKIEAEAVTDADLQSDPDSNNTSIFYGINATGTAYSFDEFEYFTGVTNCPYFDRSSLYIGLSSIKLPPSIKKIKGSLQGEGITSLELPNGVEYLDLSYMGLLGGLKVPGSVTYLHLNNFIGSVGFKLEIEEGVTSIHYIKGNNRLTELILPESLTRIDEILEIDVDTLVIPKNVVFTGNGHIKYSKINNLVFNCQSKTRLFSMQKIENVSFIEGDNYHFVSNDTIYWITDGKWCGIDFEMKVTDSTLLELPQNTSVPFSFREGFPGVSTTRKSSITTIKLPNNIYYPSIDEINCSPSLLMYYFPNYTTLVIPDGLDWYIDEQGLIIDNSTDSKAIMGCTPNTPENLMVEDLYNRMPSGSRAIGVFSYSKIKTATFTGLRYFTFDYFMYSSTVEKVTLKDFDGDFGYISFNDYSFYNCKNLKTLEIVGPSCIDCGYYSFSDTLIELFPLPLRGVANSLGCRKLKEVTLTADCRIGSWAFDRLLDLHKITCLAATAPSLSYTNVFGTSTSSYTGRNTYNTGENMLYVPAGATGYDRGEWLDPLCNSEKCGFTLSATL